MASFSFLSVDEAMILNAAQSIVIAQGTTKSKLIINLHFKFHLTLTKKNKNPKTIIAIIKYK